MDEIEVERGEPMKLQVESIYQDGMKTNRLPSLFKLIESGEFSRAHLIYYLSGLQTLFGLHEEVLLKLSLRSDSPQWIGAYLKMKHREETGHDQWAKEDLKRISAAKSSRVNHSEEVRPLTELVKELANKPAHLFILYAYFLEKFTVNEGKQWVQTLLARCPIDPSEITALTNHIRLDGEHEHEGAEFIERMFLERLISEGETSALFGKIWDRYCEFCDRVLEAVNRDESYSKAV